MNSSKKIFLFTTLTASLLALSGCDLFSKVLSRAECEALMETAADNDADARTMTMQGIASEYTDVYEGSSGAAAVYDETHTKSTQYDNQVLATHETDLTYNFTPGNNTHVGEETITTDTFIVPNETDVSEIVFVDEVLQSSTSHLLTELPTLINVGQGAFAYAMYKTIYLDTRNSSSSITDAGLTLVLSGSTDMSGKTTITLKAVDTTFIDYGTINVDAETTIKFHFGDRFEGYDWEWYYKTSVDMEGHALSSAYTLYHLQASVTVAYTANGDYDTSSLLALGD
ncbi:MAG: hypothetical protein NTV44_06010 [Firmicutes bacterium]|nr:hypothetical protein [Bacillota bacterium]